MRLLGLLLLGIAIGAFAAVSILNSLRPATAFPRGVMALSRHHMGELRDATTAEPCRPDAIERHLGALAMLAADVEPAFLPDGQKDPIFSRYARQHGDRIQLALTQLPTADCAALKLVLGDIGDNCKACHRDYK